MFEHEYDSDSLCLVHPQGRDFTMYVTPRYKWRYESQSYEGFTADLLANCLSGAKLFIDVGAHYGFYSLLAATRHPELEVIAIEPTPEGYETLKRNVSLNRLSRVSLRQAAVSGCKGRHRFNLSVASDCGSDANPMAPPYGSIDVDSMTIDELLGDRSPCPAVIKCDTEGHEVAVLAGMEETLSRFRDLSLFVKFNPAMLQAAGQRPEALLERLEHLGFAIYFLDDKSRRPYRLRSTTPWMELIGESGYGNLYCVRADQALSLCFVSHSPQLAGAERDLLQLVAVLVKKYGAVITVLLPHTGPLQQALEKAGAACIIVRYDWWCAMPPVVTGPDDVLRLKPSVIQVLGDAVPLLQKIDPDVIVTQTLVIPWGAVLAALLGKPHVWSVQEFGMLDHDLRFFVPFEQLTQDIVSCSSLVFTVSDAVACELFPNLAPDRRGTLYPDISVPRVDAASTHTNVYHTAGALRIGVFAKLDKGKGQEDAVLAVSQLVSKGRNVELLLAGLESVPERKRLDDLIKAHGLVKHVHIPGFLPNPYPAMAQTDIVLACSRHEAFGRTPVEAMMLGKPVIYAAAAGFLEYMIDGQTGLSYPPGDPAALAQKIELLLDNPDLRTKLAQQGREYAQRRFSEPTCTYDFFRRVKALCRNGSPPPVPRTIQSVVAAGLAEVCSKAALNMEREARFESILNSKSWRYTAPLRRLKKFIWER